MKKAQRGNCEILRAFYYNYCYAYAMWYEQQKQRQHRPLRVINRLTIIHPGQQNNGEKEFQDVPGVVRGGGNAACGEARQGEAIKAQDLKYFPSGGPFRGAAGHAYKPVDSPRSHIRVELPPISPLHSIAALPSQRHPHPVPVPVCLLRRKSAHNVDTHRNRHAARCVATRCVCVSVCVCVRLDMLLMPNKNISSRT